MNNSMRVTTPPLKDKIAEHGFAFLEEHRPDMDSLLVAAVVGEPLTPWEGGLVQRLVPRADSAPNTYSGIYGLDGFPFHTDLAHWRRPPRYLLLRCVKGYRDVPTLLIDGRAIIAAVTLDILTRAIVKPRRPRDGAIPLLRLCEQVEDGHRLRWDEVFLKPASRNGQTGSHQVRTFLSEVDSLSIALANTGDTLIVDNWRMLHARSPIVAGHEGRVIERVYLEALH
ncbi:TauD/TfdA family dioxygenase [Magnetospira thiophila]